MTDAAQLIDRINTRSEWLLVRENGRTFPLAADELEFDRRGDTPRLAFIDDGGHHTRSIRRIRFADNNIEIDIAGAFGAAGETIRLIPRILAAELAADIEAARLATANAIANAFVDSLAGCRIERVSLDGQAGRIAQIEFKSAERRRIAVIADVTGQIRPDTLIASAMLRYDRLVTRKRDAVDDVYLLFEKKHLNRARDLFAMLNETWRSRLSPISIDRTDEPAAITFLAHKKMHDLWRSKAAKLDLQYVTPPTRIGRTVAAIDPDNIDIIRNKKGETIRYNGLPFLRIRRLMGRERCWLIRGRQSIQIGDDDLRLIEEQIKILAQYRSSNSEEIRNDLYRTAPEAWLESKLRRDISAIDGNLVISPLYDQFRSTSGKIDLLAIRNDGRLVIVEIKARPDREMVFQAAEYWRRVELQRRRGELAAANLFGDRTIADRPAIIYLVSPAWSIHPDTAFFAESLEKEIEVWRFELHEHWRERIGVVGRAGHDAASAATDHWRMNR